jgi:hypothetical protein
MHHRAKLPFETVQSIRRMHATGTIGYVILARAHKAIVSTIRDIITYRTRVRK